MALRGRQINAAHPDLIRRLDSELKKILEQAPEVMSRQEKDIRHQYAKIVTMKPSGQSSPSVS